MKTRKEIIEFVKSNYFAFVNGCGKCYADDDETIEQIAGIVENANYMIVIDDPEDEGCGCSELANEGTIYKFYNDNEEPLYIAVYSIYKVSDTETGNCVIYDGTDMKEAIQAIVDNSEDGSEWDLYAYGDRIWCGATDSINQLKNM